MSIPRAYRSLRDWTQFHPGYGSKTGDDAPDPLLSDCYYDTGDPVLQKCLWTWFHRALVTFPSMVLILVIAALSCMYEPSRRLSILWPWLPVLLIWIIFRGVVEFLRAEWGWWSNTFELAIRQLRMGRVPLTWIRYIVYLDMMLEQAPVLIKNIYLFPFPSGRFSIIRRKLQNYMIGQTDVPGIRDLPPRSGDIAEIYVHTTFVDNVLRDLPEALKRRVDWFWMKGEFCTRWGTVILLIYRLLTIDNPGNLGL